MKIKTCIPLSSIFFPSCTAGREKSLSEIIKENEVTNNKVLGMSKEDVAKMYSLPYMAMNLMTKTIGATGDTVHALLR